MSDKRDGEQPRASGASNPGAPPGIPAAVVRSVDQVRGDRARTRLWWLTGACLLIAIALMVISFRSRGEIIVIEFQQGHGIKPGDALRYRGVSVGQVQGVRLNDDLQRVQVEIALVPGNEAVSVEGSQFWIERPRIRIGQMSGLETVMGAKYVGVLPGPADGPRRDRFVGRESPLSMTEGEYVEIRIRFPTGEGLEVGDEVRYRGIAVGEVTGVELGESTSEVQVEVRLLGAARRLARAGTQFWIERPRLDLTEVRGLETLIAGRYIALEPSSDEGPVQTEFDGLGAPPPLPLREGSLEIELDASRRFGLVRGAPVTYRDVEVGRVSSVRISDDAASVKVTAVIDPRYAVLVRTNSRWWTTSGVKVDAGLQGVQVAIDSLSAWIRGGIAMATPDRPGPRVASGHRFVLEPEPLPEWLEWKPRIDLNRSAELGFALPQPVRVVSHWRTTWLGLPRTRSAAGWGLAVDDGRLMLPASLLQAGQDANVELQLAGVRLTSADVAYDSEGAIAWLAKPENLDVAVWPMARVAESWNGRSMLLVVQGDSGDPTPVDASRAEQTGTAIRLAPGISFPDTLEGAPVIDGETGYLVGLLLQRNGRWEIHPLPAPAQ
ncbi:MAG: MCE family protein [Planctomycetota bacterium]|nr:MAG: MCE family protein [Planctomycetota bacterium]